MGNIKQTYKQFVGLTAIIGVIVAPLGFSQLAIAAPTYTSSSYGVDEVFMGSGGVNDANSASYKARASLGDTGVGNTGSASYQAYGGFTTTPDPYIEMNATTSSVDLGYLSTTTTATTTTTFTVRTYLASGYVVVNGSDPPTATSGAGTYTLTALSSPTASTTGTEQFGINLVANTVPASLGGGVSKDPIQLPDATYSFGTAAAGYNATNQYKYAKGDTIASSAKSSGVTQYTVSYIYNIATATPAGQYTFNHVVVATSTY